MPDHFHVVPIRVGRSSRGLSAGHGQARSTVAAVDRKGQLMRSTQEKWLTHLRTNTEKRTPSARSWRIWPRLWQTVAPVYIVSWGTSRMRPVPPHVSRSLPERSVSVTLQPINGCRQRADQWQRVYSRPPCSNKDHLLLTQMLDGGRHQFATTATATLNTDWVSTRRRNSQGSVPVFQHPGRRRPLRTSWNSKSSHPRQFKVQSRPRVRA